MGYPCRGSHHPEELQGVEGMSTHPTPLGEILNFFNGKAPMKVDDGEFVLYGSNGQIGRSKSFNHENAIILGRVGAYCGSVEICANKFWASDNTIVVKTKEGYDLRYIYYCLLSSPLRSYAGGAAQPLLTQTILRGVKLQVFSDISVQRRIASKLSAYDDLIENNRRRIQLLEESARLLYREWFVRLHFPGYEYVKIIDGVPEGWEKSTLGDNIVLNYGKSLKADDRIEGPCPVYGSSGIVGTHKKAFARGPGIIVGRKGNVGSVFWSSKDFHPIDTVYYIDTESSDYYLYNALQHMQFVSSDAAVPGLNRNYAYSRPYLLPPETIRSHFENIVTPIYGQIFKLDDYNEKLKQARDLLLPRLMNGEIEV
jgi:type I restriction enzyme S subunit